MKHTGSLWLIAAAVLLGACQGGDVMGSVTTDYGFALATTEQHAPGDIDSWLVTKQGETLLGELSWDAHTQELSATVADTPVTSDAMDLSQRSLEQFNALLYQMWEAETGSPDANTCIDDGSVICCRSTAWHCGQSQRAR